jgi:molybdenum cofactor cytidylyltransferase
VRVRAVGLLLAAGRGQRFAAARAERAGRAAGTRGAAHPLGGPSPASVDDGGAGALPDDALRDALADARIVECPDADPGMGRSLAAAARTAIDDGADAVQVMPADTPWLAPDTACTITGPAREGGEDARAARIVVPELPDGRRGHPVAFGAAHLPALARRSGDRGARALLEAFPLRLAPVDDAGILRDVDMPRDLPPP